MSKEKILIRKSDGKVFRFVFKSYWSNVESDDGERDIVKYFNIMKEVEYVSREKGDSYILSEED